MTSEKSTHEYKIAYILSKVGQKVGRQKILEVTAGSKDEALTLFESQKVEGYNYHILYWET